ncbi:MAG: phosphopantetheine-binding protein [Oscillospiraceae bacterium]
MFDSFDIIQTINSLNEEFDIEIPATEIVPQNFNSAAALWAMVERLMEE